MKLKQRLHSCLDENANSRWASVSQYNLGKCLLSRDDSIALECFFRAGDLSQGTLVEVLSNIFAARIHFRNNDPRLAIPLLQKSLTITADEKLLSETALMLVASHYMANEYSDGKEVLLWAVKNLDLSTSQNEVVVLSSLLNSGKGSSESANHRSASQLLSSLSNLKSRKLFGEHWGYLMIVAYQQLGFLEETERLLTGQFASLNKFPIGKYLQNLHESGRSQAAQVDDVSAQKHVIHLEGASVVELHSYYKALSAQPLENQQKITRVLQCLGKAYQALGEHELAIQCYTGNLGEVTNPQ